MTAVEDLLRDNPIFSTGGAALEVLLASAEERSCARDGFVLREGEESGRTVVLLEGTVRVSDAS